MLSHILKSIICDEYSNRIHPRDGWNTKALLMKFSVSYDTPMILDKNGDSERYPSIELLVYGPSNYIGVYVKERVRHPDEETRWYLIARHDSCWRDDGVGRFLHHIEDHCTTLSGPIGHWYDEVYIEDELVEELVKIVKETRNGKLDRYWDVEKS